MITTITFINHDIEKEDVLPFQDEYFDVVTMLAVFEHIEFDKLVRTIKEIYRILKKGGIYIMTTPAAWTDGLLRFMAKLRLVSSAEIDEHKWAYSLSRIAHVIQEGNFLKENLQLGYFEMFMNLWAMARK
ncbi:MAG: class I SAM-dependent methyltransferase [Deltaproteobacteria bacterium]|nr:class I SAM-dependent methyltransferase [Deltaproteobacteria bacterium]